MMQSSANNLSDEEILLLISLIYSKNITGPRTVPCGTPDMTLAYSDSNPSITTLCDLWVSQEDNQLCSLPLIP